MMEKKMVGGQRQCGKSRYLIKRSAETRIPILTFNGVAAQIIKSEAASLGLEIPNPIWIDALKGVCGTVDKRGVLVDEIELVVQRLLNVKVHESTTSSRFKQLPSLHDETHGDDKSTREVEDNKQDIEGLIKFYPSGLQRYSINDFRVKCELPVIEKVVTGLEALDYLSQGKILVDKESGTKYIPVKHADVILEVNKNEKKIVDKIEIKREYLVQS